ncbi:Methyltransferase domain-containing protein [Arboricoccus pini]|uniref:Methyltransferase domain-containing protein n=1 Tax=Arboricoccus pini TaxID=1963835 RepID=A0A212Q1H0_9PROT|nr:class I SAM-dependent methyltransferase [Arboricoccus pini]SNB53123.1 Methyltransferase domain-containing protein [Arboricoccus pini]
MGWQLDRPVRRRLGALLSLVGNRRPQGFLVPYRHADRARPGRSLAIERLLRQHETAAFAWLTRAAAELEILEPLLGQPPAPRFKQDWFPRLDGLLAFTMVAACRPRRIVEIGSGHSTRFMAAAIARHGLSCELTAIDPTPRADIKRLPIRHEARLFDTKCLPLTAGLEADDILFIDSSHVAMPGTDVDLLLGEVVPTLAAGVVVHIHDIFLPEPYPASWKWRGYNEQSLVSALLLGGVIEPLIANHWMVAQHEAMLRQLRLDRIELPAGAFESSLWGRRTGSNPSPGSLSSG